MLKQNQVDLDFLHDRQTSERENFSMHVRHILEMGSEELKHSGHKTTEQALIYAARSHIKKLNELVQAYLKKWPD
jgi:hypothetical protein